jgi:2'-5' RNA ligase
VTPTQSVLLVPALDMIPLVQRFRLRYDPNAALGVPPHITILFPFIAPDQLTDLILADVTRVFESVNAFDYSLNEAREFDEGVLYVAPEPDAPFIELTAMASKHFGLQPYGGAHSSVVPHLTVAQTAPSPTRRRIAAALQEALPRRGRASEAWLMVGGDGGKWKRRISIRFRRTWGRQRGA